MKPADILKKFKTVANAASNLGFQRRTIYYWIEKEAIPWHTQRSIELQTGGALKAAKK